MKCWLDFISMCSDLSGSNLRSGRDVFVQSVHELYKKIALYTAGFPCTPYSCLNNKQLMLQDPNAQQLWRCLQNISDTQPGVSWMQTVECVLEHFLRYNLQFDIVVSFLCSHDMIPQQLRWPSWRMCWDLFVWWTRFSRTSEPSCRRILATVHQLHIVWLNIYYIITL